MKLKDMPVGSRGRITAILPGEKSYRHRLLSLGLLPGTDISVSRLAPLSDPIEIIVRGVALSLRKHEANILEIEGVTA